MSLLFVVLLVVAAVSSIAQQSAPPRPAFPVEPIAAIIDAFGSHSVVALDEGDHGNEQGHAFRLALIRDPRFANSVNDIVVESRSGYLRRHAFSAKESGIQLRIP